MRNNFPDKNNSQNIKPCRPDFRADINGLRAWAVLAVIFYHFSIPGFSGGFVGVDIFFVISGFLMTKIVVEGLEQGNFSLWHFYLARARRIIPALLVLCLCLLLMGWFWLLNADYQALAKQVQSATLFISNILFFNETGYFGGSAHEKWLLHTWSLSVEWQFYLLLPLFALFIWRCFAATGLKYLLGLLAIVSLSLSVYQSQQNPDAAFYLLQYRAWEMIVGAGLWWFTRHKSLPKKICNVLELIGFALICYAIYRFDASLAWPGSAALVPVIGAALILLAGQQQSWLTNNWMAQRLGNSSYSLYLWHWPLVVALNYTNKLEDISWILSALLLTLLLAELSLKWVEKPCRLHLATFTKLTSTTVFIIVSALVVFMTQMIVNQNITGRIPEAIKLAESEAKNYNPKRKQCLLRSKKGGESPLCEFGNGEPNMIVMGDSHANALVSAAGEAAAKHNGSAIELSLSICSNLIGLQRYGDKRDACLTFNERYINALATTDFLADIPLVLITRHSYYLHGPNEPNHKNFGKALVYFSEYNPQPNKKLDAEYQQALIDTTCLLAQNRPVYLLRPIPEMAINVPKTMARNLMLGEKEVDISITLAEYHQRHALVWAAQDQAAKQCGATILDPLPYLCPAGRCISQIDGRPLYYDDDHLSEFGNKLLVPMFEQVFN